MLGRLCDEEPLVCDEGTAAVPVLVPVVELHSPERVRKCPRTSSSGLQRPAPHFTTLRVLGSIDDALCQPDCSSGLDSSQKFLRSCSGPTTMSDVPGVHRSAAIVGADEATETAGSVEGSAVISERDPPIHFTPPTAVLDSWDASQSRQSLRQYRTRRPTLNDLGPTAVALYQRRVAGGMPRSSDASWMPSSERSP